MSVSSLFSWFVCGFLFALVLYIPIFGFNVIKNFLATAADDIRGS